jgi:hypothetical protein
VTDDRRRFPRSGIAGDYNGSCVVCGRDTDTALGFRGRTEWLIEALVALGVPEPEAVTMVDRFSQPGGVMPDGRHFLGVQVCSACVAAAAPRFPKPAVVVPGKPVPTVAQVD